MLRVCIGHFSFGQNVAFHRTILEERLKIIKRSVRQRSGKKLEEPRVERSGSGFMRISSFMCCKFLLFRIVFEW